MYMQSTTIMSTTVFYQSIVDWDNHLETDSRLSPGDDLFVCIHIAKYALQNAHEYKQ